MSPAIVSQGTCGLCSTTSDSTMRTRSRSTGPRYCAANLCVQMGKRRNLDSLETSEGDSESERCVASRLDDSLNVEDG